jgi:hypothetical protein
MHFMASLLVGRSVLIVAVTVAAVLLAFGQHYYSWSIDLAFHYSLARNIAESWALPHEEAYLGYMGSYPPVAHLFAAIVGSFLGSTMLGMTSAALGAVVGIYIFLLSMMRFNRRDAAVFAYIIFCCSVISLRRHNVFFGGEIIGNFFFAQVIGVFLSFAAYYAITAVKGSLTQGILTVCTTYLLGWVYPLAQVYLATSCFSFIALSGLQEVLSYRALKTPTVISLSLLLVGLPLAIARHPTFRLMASAAQDNAGYVGSLSAGSVVGCAIALLFVAGILFVFLLRGNLDLVNPIRFVALAVAVACSGILQWIVLRFFGNGSEYAVVKHGFGIVTLLVASIAVLLASRLRFSSFAITTKRNSPLPLLLAAATSFVLVFVVFPAGRPIRPMLDDIDFAKRVSTRDPGGELLGATVVLDPRLTTVEQFSIAFGELKMHVNAAIAFYLSQEGFGIPQSAWDEEVAYLKAHPTKYAIAWSEGEPAPSPSCIFANSPTASLVLVDYSCVEQGVAYRLETWVHPNRLLRAKSFLGSGWSAIEPWGVWSSGKEASIHLVLQAESTLGDLVLEVDATGNVSAEHLEQRVGVSANRQDVGNWIITTAAPTRYEIKIPQSAVTGGHLDIHFSLPDAVAGSPGDPRELALGLIDFRLRRSSG